MTNNNIISYIYTIILVHTKQCRTPLDYHFIITYFIFILMTDLIALTE